MQPGIIQLFSSPWSSPLHMVLIKENTWKLGPMWRLLCFDCYPMLQLYTQFYNHPSWLNYFLKVSAYYQISMEPPNIHKIGRQPSPHPSAIWSMESCTILPKIRMGYHSEQLSTVWNQTMVKIDQAKEVMLIAGCGNLASLCFQGGGILSTNQVLQWLCDVLHHNYYFTG